MELSDLAKVSAFSGFWLLVQLGAAAFAWHRLRKHPPAWRLVAAIIAFMVPVVALVGLIISSRLQHAAVQAVGRAVKPAIQASAQAATRPHAPTAPSQAMQTQASTMDPARLLSPDIHVRFDTAPQAGRQLNIPKVVE